MYVYVVHAWRHLCQLANVTKKEKKKFVVYITTPIRVEREHLYLDLMFRLVAHFQLSNDWRDR